MENNIISVVDALFAGSTASYTTRAGKQVEFAQANLKSIGVVSNLLNTLAQSPLAARFATFVQEVASEQAALLQNGQAPTDFDLNRAVILKKAFVNHSLLLDAFVAAAEALPKFVGSFATISATEYDELALDEQLVVAAGVVAVNYAFFTQSLRPIIISVMQGLNAKNGSKQEPARK